MPIAEKAHTLRAESREWGVKCVFGGWGHKHTIAPNQKSVCVWGGGAHAHFPPPPASYASVIVIIFYYYFIFLLDVITHSGERILEEIK